MTRILKHVVQGIADLERLRERACVIAIREHRALAPPEAIECARNAHAQALHGAGECALALRFADEMDVIADDHVFHDAHAEAIRARDEASLDDFRFSPVAQVPQTRRDPRRDEQRMARLQSCTTRVPDTRTRTRRFPPSARTRTAPPLELEHTLLAPLLGPHIVHDEQRVLRFAKYSRFLGALGTGAIARNSIGQTFALEARSSSADNCALATIECCVQFVALAQSWQWVIRGSWQVQPPHLDSADILCRSLARDGEPHGRSTLVHGRVAHTTRPVAHTVAAEISCISFRVPWRHSNEHDCTITSTVPEPARDRRRSPTSKQAHRRAQPLALRRAGRAARGSRRRFRSRPVRRA